MSETQVAPLMYTVEEAAQRLRISETTVWDLMKSGQLAWIAIPSARGEGKRTMRRIEGTEIDAFLERHRQPAAAAS